MVNPNVVKMRESMLDAMREFGDDVSAEEMLALTSHLVGQMIALQDERKYTSEMILKLVHSNIEQGNAEAIFDVMLNKERHNG